MDAGVFHKDCFACGEMNANGLRLSFDSYGHSVLCRTSINQSQQSYEGIVHGGIVATLLDAAMVRCLRVRFGRDPFTCKLDIRFVKSLPVETEITVEAIALRERGQICWAEGVIKCRGDVYAKGFGTFKLFGNRYSVRE